MTRSEHRTPEATSHRSDNGLETLIDDGRLTPRISVIVPVFNEANTVVELLNQLNAEPTSKEIIIVNDGSTDLSDSLIRTWIEQLPTSGHRTRRVLYLQHAENLGKGSCIRTGLQQARGEYVVPQDADLELLPAAYTDLLQPLVQKRCRVVLGVRSSSNHRQRRLFVWGVSVTNTVLWLLYGSVVSDSACCFKITETQLLNQMDLRCKRFEFCPEFLAKAARMNLSFQEVPVDYIPRTTDQGKKLRLVRDGVRCIATLIRYRFWRASDLPTGRGQSLSSTTPSSTTTTTTTERP